MNDLPLWRRVRRRVARIAPLRTAYDRVELALRYRALSPERVQLPSGTTLFVNPAEPRGRAILLNGGTGQPGLKRLWRRAVAALEPDVVIDVGANYGEFIFAANYAANVVGLAIEADEDLCSYLRRSRDAHPNASQIDIRCALASAAPGDAVSFYVDKRWSGRSSALKQELHRHTELRTVPTISVDSALRGRVRSGAALVFKVDVEGYEPFVVSGMQEVLAQAGSTIGLLEFNGAFLDKVGEGAQKFLERLQHQFRVVAFDREERPICLDGRTLFEVFGQGPIVTDLVLVSDFRLYDQIGLQVAQR